MDAKQLQTPATAIDIAKLLNIEGMPVAGLEIIRRMGFELTMLKSQLKELKRGNERLHDLHLKRSQLTASVIADRDELNRQNKILMEFMEWAKLYGSEAPPDLLTRFVNDALESIKEE